MISLSSVTSPLLNSQIYKWQTATWDDYLAYRDHPNLERVKLFYQEGYLLIEMGAEGINHASMSDLFTMLFAFWFTRFPVVSFSSLGRCQLEKANHRASAPDQVLYIGENSPRWQQGEPRRIDLNRWRVPDLVGEVSDPTLATDLDEKKQLYAALGIPEYWVTDVKGKQVIAFSLGDNGKYEQIEYSLALSGLPIILLEQTLEQLTQMENGLAALWFNQQIANINIKE
ncbi:MAG TPA: Uma2 family endonuclease [Planktothrix sp. UBA10369]|nr:Uma2 family endonuclease [Planktothrix sp. UBA10369]